MSVSIKQVAKEANVSVSAASKALNDYPDIGEETRRRVKRVARELGYVPNRNAKRLASKSTKDVAILWSGVIDDKSMDEITTSMMKGASRYALDHGMNVATYMIDSEVQNKKPLRDFCYEYSLSGVLLFGLRTDDRYVMEASESKVPCVGVDYAIAGKYTSSVRVDDCKAFEEITEYVLQNNHRKCILVYGRRDAEVAVARYEGFCRALEKWQLSSDQMPIIYTNFFETEAYLETKKFIEKYGKENGTVFICMSDMLAMGVYKAVRDMGYRIPEDFSVTGYDGLDFLKYVEPRLTTINQKFYRKGYEAIRLLARMVNGETEISEVILPHNLIKGDSVSRI